MDTVGHHGRRCSSDHAAGCERPQLLSRGSIVRVQVALGRPLEDESARRVQRAAVHGQRIALPPHLALGERIPGHELAEGLPLRIALTGVPRVVAELPTGPALAPFGHRHRGDEEHVLLGVEGQRDKIVRTAVARNDDRGLIAGRFPIASRGIEDRSPRLFVETFRPVDLYVVSARDELAGLRVQEIDEAVLRHTEDDSPVLAIDGQGGRHEPHRGFVIPSVARHLGEMPPVLTGLSIQGDDGTREQLVARAFAPFRRIRRGGRAGSDDELVQFGVVHHGVPDAAAALGLLIPAFAPGLQRHLVQFTVLRLARVARNRVETPQVFAGLCIHGIHVTAIEAHITAGVTDEDLVSPNARRAGNHVVPLAIAGFSLPSLDPGRLIDCDKPTI